MSLLALSGSALQAAMTPVGKGEMRRLFERNFSNGRYNKVLLEWLYFSNPRYRSILNALIEIYAPDFETAKKARLVTNLTSFIYFEKALTNELLFRMANSWIGDEEAFLDELYEAIDVAETGRASMDVEE